MNWLHDHFNSFKYDNAKKWEEYSKEYSEVMELLLDEHNEINELRDQLKSLDSKVKEDEDSSCEDVSSLRSKLNGLDYQIKKNEEDTYNAINDKVEYFEKQFSGLRDMNKKLTFAIEENKEMLNAIRTEMSNKEEKEEND